MAAQILILEDDELLSSLLAIALERAGYEPQTASTIEDARELLATGQFDMVVSDHILGGQHLGDDFTAECVRSGTVRAAILISGWADVRHPDNRQCSTFLQKPFAMDTFLGAVRDALDRPPAERGAH